RTDGAVQSTARVGPCPSGRATVQSAPGRANRISPQSFTGQSALVVHTRLGHGTGPDSRRQQGMTSAEPVWITGLGTANPMGHDFATVADNLLAGKSGVRTITDL